MNIRIIWYRKDFSFCVTSHVFDHWSHICKPLFISHCIIKTKVLLPQAGDLNRFWRSCLGPVVYFLTKLFKLFGFPTFRFWAYLMKAILSVPDEGYSERTWWRLFWAYLMKVIVGVPDEGYSRYALCAQNLISTFYCSKSTFWLEYDNEMSANNFTILPRLSIMSFIYNRNNKRSSTHSCGTPALTKQESGNSLFTNTNCLLSFK